MTFNATEEMMNLSSLEPTLAPEQSGLLSKLRKMGSPAFTKTYLAQISNPLYENMSFELRLGEMIDAQNDLRLSNRIQRKIKAAKFRDPKATLEEIEYLPDRGLSKTKIDSLADETYIGRNEHVILLGAAGAGKTYLACALGNQACRDDISVLYTRMPELMRELQTSRLAGTYDETLKRYRKVPLLIIDEFLLLPATTQECRDLFVVCVQLTGVLLCGLLTLLRMTVLREVLVYQTNPLMNANLAFLGYLLVIMAMFNILFLGGFYKSAYYYGKPFILFCIAAFVVVGLGETLHHIPGLGWLNAVTGAGVGRQIVVLLAGVVIYAVGTLLSLKRSEERFEKLDL